MRHVMVEGNFVLINLQPGECPCRFVISANRHGAPAMQRTLVKSAAEDDRTWWLRVLANVRDMAVHREPFDPFSSTYGGAIECFYDCPLSEGEYAKQDAQRNFLATMQCWAHAPAQPWECRGFAISFLERRVHQAPPTLQ